MSIVGNAIIMGGGETLTDAGGVSFGGTYALIRVTYPSGSTCTCTKGNTTLTAEDTSGSYTFLVEAPVSGVDTWTVSCTNGSVSAMTSVAISSARIFSIKLDYAYISVTYPTGSTCTCTNGNTTLTASDTSGNYTFIVSVPLSGIDTWTVNCTDGTDSASDTINISTDGINDVVLRYASSTIVFYHRNKTFNAISGWTWNDFITDLRGDNIMNPGVSPGQYSSNGSNPTIAGFPICYDSACKERVYLTDTIIPNATYYDDE